MHDFFNEVPEQVKAAGLAGLLTFMRLSYARSKLSRKIWETLICVAITWGVGKGVAALGLSIESAYLFAVTIGWMGADFVREHARNAIIRKVDKL
ncbi:MAG: phage holin, lambda family [Marinagarivorans sp.]|nr:phage holin, lambda family [Marinagarivorans sp.]